jgi:hypothetical protein
VYQLRMEMKTENNTPLATLPNVRIITTIGVDVLWDNEFKVKQSWQNILLPRRRVWKKVVWNANQEFEPHLIIVVLFHGRKFKGCNDPSFPNQSTNWFRYGRRIKRNLCFEIL